MLVYGLELQKQKVVKVRKSMNAPSLPIQHWQTNGKTRGYLQQTQVLPSVPLSYWWRADGGATGSKLMQKHKLKPCMSSRCCGYYPDAAWCAMVKTKGFPQIPWTFPAAMTYRWRKISSRASFSAWFLIRVGQKCVAVMINKWPVIAALLCRPDFTFTLSLWGRPNDFYLPLRKHIKAISDCGSPSVFDHTAAVLAEVRLVSLGSSFCSLCKQKEALRKSSWLIPFASIPLLKAVRRLPGKPNMTAKTKHDSARRRTTRHSWGIEAETLFNTLNRNPPEGPENTQEISSCLCLSELHMCWWTCETWGDRWACHKGIQTCKMSGGGFWQDSRPWFFSLHIIC